MQLTSPTNSVPREKKKKKREASVKMTLTLFTEHLEKQEVSREYVLLKLKSNVTKKMTE